MQDYDVVKHEYLQNNERFADFMNGANFNGRQVISPEDLASLDNRETRISKQRTGRKGNKRDYGARYRDLIRKSAMGMNFVLLGIENQSHIHYAMPIRNLAYDSWNYDSQLRQIQYRHKENKDLQGTEFLSGFSKEDLLKPVVTWVLYWGTEPWDAATDLHGLLDFTDIPDDLKGRVNNYKLNILSIWSILRQTSSRCLALFNAPMIKRSWLLMWNPTQISFPICQRMHTMSLPL